MWYYKKLGRDDQVIRMRMKEIAETRVRYGSERIFILLRREGFKDRYNRVYRLYKLEGLNLRTKRPRRNRSGVHRLERTLPSHINECSSMDFVSDQQFDGRKFRSLIIVDNYTRSCLDIYAEQGIKGKQVVTVLERLNEHYMVVPEKIRVDNGSEFISKALDKRSYGNHVILDFSRPEKPTDNAYIESFNGSFRDGCLNTNWFLSLEDATEKIEACRTEYNTFKPHSSLEGLTPQKVWEKCQLKL